MNIDDIYDDMLRQSPDCLNNAIFNLKEMNISYTDAIDNIWDERLNSVKRAAYYYFILITESQEKC